MVNGFDLINTIPSSGHQWKFSFVWNNGWEKVILGLVRFLSYGLCVWTHLCVHKGWSPKVRCVYASDNSLSAASLVWLCTYMYVCVRTGRHGPALCHCSGLASLVYQLQTHWTLTHTHPSWDTHTNTHAQCSWALCMPMPSAFKKRKMMLVWLFTCAHTLSKYT